MRMKQRETERSRVFVDSGNCEKWVFKCPRIFWKLYQKEPLLDELNPKWPCRCLG